MDCETMTEASSPSSPAYESESEPDPYWSSPPVTPYVPRLGVLIPNRLFVGRIDFRTTESDIWDFFSQHGAVKEVNIVVNHLGVSKGYGFVTFETQEDVQRILQGAAGLCFQSKRLTVGLAVRRQHRRGRGICQVEVCDPGVTPPCGSVQLTTPNGHPYTFHNGVAYFHASDPASSPHQCPVMSSPPVVLPPPPEAAVQPPPTFHHCQYQVVGHVVHLAYHQMYAPGPVPVWPRQEYAKIMYPLVN